MYINSLGLSKVFEIEDHRLLVSALLLKCSTVMQVMYHCSSLSTLVGGPPELWSPSGVYHHCLRIRQNFVSQETQDNIYLCQMAKDWKLHQSLMYWTWTWLSRHKEQYIRILSKDVRGPFLLNDRPAKLLKTGSEFMVHRLYAVLFGI